MFSWLPTLENLRQHVRPADVIDVVVVAVLIYFILLWLTQRTTRTVLLAVGGAAALFLIAQQLGMVLTLSLFHAGLTALLLGLVLVFQEDLRRALEQMTAWGRSREVGSDRNARVIDTLIESVEHLADRAVGALIVVRGREPLSRHIRGGVRIDGLVSLPLLSSIFDAHSPGHDGAAILHGERIAEFGTHLPLSKNLAEVGTGGTRHTAALGLAERSDALVLIVSEERGTISIALEGQLQETVSTADLRNRLETYFEQVRPTPGAPRGQWLFRNPGTKLAAVGLACLAWLMFAYPRETRQQAYDSVTIAFQNVPEGWRVLAHSPEQVRVTLAGSERLFRAVDLQDLTVSLDLSKARPGVQEFPITDEMVNAAAGLAVEDIEPRTVQVEVWPMRRVTVAVAPPTRGELPPGLVLSSIESRPRTVALLVRSVDVDRLKTISTGPIDLSGIDRDLLVTADLVLPHGAQFAESTPAQVQVLIEVERERASQ